MFLKSWSTGRCCCSSLRGYDRTIAMIRTLRTKDCKLHEYRVHASCEFGAARKMFSSFAVLLGEGDEEKET